MPPCPGCLGDFPENPAVDAGPTHDYMLSSAACWATYGRILAREYSAHAYMRMHRLTVDTYAVQHPGVNVPAARRSVVMHLSRLHLLLARGWPIERANEAAITLSARKDQREWLNPPSMDGTLTVLDVIPAEGIAEHECVVRAWADSVWKAWSPHHAMVRSWCEEL